MPAAPERARPAGSEWLGAAGTGLVYERAVFSGDAGLLAEADRELDAAEADLAVARGRLLHTRFLLCRDQDPAAAEQDPSCRCSSAPPGCARGSVMSAVRPRR